MIILMTSMLAQYKWWPPPVKGRPAMARVKPIFVHKWVVPMCCYPEMIIYERCLFNFQHCWSRRRGILIGRPPWGGCLPQRLLNEAKVYFQFGFRVDFPRFYQRLRLRIMGFGGWRMLIGCSSSSGHGRLTQCFRKYFGHHRLRQVGCWVIWGGRVVHRPCFGIGFACPREKLNGVDGRNNSSRPPTHMTMYSLERHTTPRLLDMSGYVERWRKMQRIQKVEEQHFCRGPFKSRHDNARRVLLVMTLFKFRFGIADNQKNPQNM